ncbi:MAG: putative DNA binding domain-containing protein [Gammaproteobacteria bacterium]|nr:putative DNA binding domain-containing protein [Gammaproteobacteria bacterium]MCY4339950.1 putative DNA binding domain-containing protein [Gammaproteobacteria bacterium]
MEWLDVLRRIESGEDARTEFKRGLGDFSGVGKTLCAFANGDGGLVVIGVDDTGSIVGTNKDPESVQERLTSFLNNGCGKPISAECNRKQTREGWVHWVDVRRHLRRYEPFSYDGRFWIRRGRATVAPSPSELQELFNAFGLVLTEHQIISSATADEIDLSAFRSFMRAQGMHMERGPQPIIENDLRNASVCELLDGVLHPTLYGVMVFGRDPQGHPHTKSLFIQCVSYDGIDQAGAVLSSGEGKGCLDEQVTRSVEWFRSLGRREVYQGLYRKDVSLLPEAVLREALVNAVIHRDYALTGSQVLLEVFSDRICVTSPGSLPNHMSIEQVRSGGAPRSRNEMMANAMVVKGLMERRGRGWLLMRHGMREFNGTEPDLICDAEGGFTRVTFRLRPDQS